MGALKPHERRALQHRMEMGASVPLLETQDIPPELCFTWNIFWELRHGTAADLPIALSEKLLAWREFVPDMPRGEFLSHMRDMDDEYLSWRADEYEKMRRRDARR